MGVAVTRNHKLNWGSVVELPSGSIDVIVRHVGHVGRPGNKYVNLEVLGEGAPQAVQLKIEGPFTKINDDLSVRMIRGNRGGETRVSINYLTEHLVNRKSYEDMPCSVEFPVPR